MVVTVPLVGRADDLAWLVDVAAGGSSERVAVVVGDAGIGKTRLLAEARQQWTGAGITVVLGACLPLAEALPLLPVIDVLRDLTRVRDGLLVEEVLAALPGFVRPEIARLLPELGAATRDAGRGEEGGPGEGWRRERLFTAVRVLLEAATARARIVVVVEDVHWADRSSLDLLRLLIGAPHPAGVPLVVTYRGDDPETGPEVREWLAAVSVLPGVAQRHLQPLSMDETADQVSALAGARPSATAVVGLFRRTQGNPFFTEQLIAAAGPAGQDAMGVDAVLPSSLATLLRARTRRASPTAGQVLAVLAVADRPVDETLIAAVTGLDSLGVEEALIELIEARLATCNISGRYQLRHQLLAEVVTGGLLPARRCGLHAAIADAMTATPHAHPPAEIATHYAAAGNVELELVWTAAAAQAAEDVHAYPEAARHWRRVTLLWDIAPATPPDLTLGHAYIHAVDAGDAGGDWAGASAQAEEALTHISDPFVRAVLLNRVSVTRRRETSLEVALQAVSESTALFAELPVSTERARALVQYGVFLDQAGRHDEALQLMSEGLEVARECGSRDCQSAALMDLALHDMLHGDPEHGLSRLTRAGELVQDSTDLRTVASVATLQTDTLLRTGQQAAAHSVGCRALELVRALGGASFHETSFLAANVGMALLELGDTRRATDLIDPMTLGEPGVDDWPVHELRVRVDAARGHLQAAKDRLDTLSALTPSTLDHQMEVTHTTADVALWRGEPQGALDMIESLLPLVAAGTFHSRDAGLLLTHGMRACADIAELAGARSDQDALNDARAAGQRLITRHRAFRHDPFRPHPLVAIASASHAAWLAETARLSGENHAELWRETAIAWEELGRPHPAGYALWREAEVHLAKGHAAEGARVLRRAAELAAEMAPLLAEITALARRARIDLRPQQTPPPPTPSPYGLTDRERDVLVLLVEGKTNAQIGAALFISPKTASVHVTHILRKLDVTGRVQAATLAERSGIVHRRPHDTD